LPIATGLFGSVCALALFTAYGRYLRVSPQGGPLVPNVLHGTVLGAEHVMVSRTFFDVCVVLVVIRSRPRVLIISLLATSVAFPLAVLAFSPYLLLRFRIVLVDLSNEARTYHLGPTDLAGSETCGSTQRPTTSERASSWSWPASLGSQ
jgi:hypothetical protein